MFSADCTYTAADWNVRLSLHTLHCWLFFIWLLSLWKTLCITANRRCIYLCWLRGCQLLVQPGKPYAGSALPTLPPTWAHRQCRAGNKTKIVSGLLVLFPQFSGLPAHLRPGSGSCLALCRTPGQGGCGQPGLRVLWGISRLPAEAELLLNSEAKASGLPSA